MPKIAHHFDGMSWPLPGDEPEGDGLEWRLRYASDTAVGDRLHAAFIVSAYRELIMCPAKKRNAVIRELRAALRR